MPSATENTRPALQRLWIDACIATVVAIAIGWIARHALTPDGVAYFENAELLARGHFREALQGYWSPGYSIVLVPVSWVAGNDRGLFLALAHVLQAVACIAGLWLAAVVIERRTPAAVQRFVFWACAWVMLQWVSQELLTPDLLLCVLVLLFFARLERRAEIELGAIVGAAFLVKTSCWPWLVALAGVVAIRHSGAANRGAFPKRAFATAGAIAGAFVIALSVREGHPTIGSVGPLNAHWYLGDVTRRLPDSDNGPHALKKNVYLPGGEPIAYIDLRDETRTYMPWSDPEQWADGVPAESRPRFNLGMAERSWRESARIAMVSLLPIAAAMLALIVIGRDAGASADAPGGAGTSLTLAVAIAAALPFMVLHAELRLLAPAALILLVGWWPATTESRWGAWVARAAMALIAVKLLVYVADLRHRSVALDHRMQTQEAQFAELTAHNAERGVVILGSGTLWMPELWREHLHVSVQVGAQSANRMRFFPATDRSEMLRGWFGAGSIGVAEARLVTSVDGSLSMVVTFQPW